MAKLRSNQLTLEVRFREFDDDCWVQYDVLFLWDGEAMPNDALLKRSPSGWANRSKGAFLANEYDGDSLLPVLRRVLEENTPDYWEPTEPDIILAFYPEMIFPFLPPHMQLVYEADHIKQTRIERDHAKTAAGGRLPDDPVTIVAFADAYQWRECTAYAGDGLALVLLSRRRHLQQFYDDLAREYEAFRRDSRIEERLRECDRPHQTHTDDTNDA